MRILFAALVLALSGGTSLAHEVHATLEPAGAVSVRILYADGKPFAFEAYEVWPAGGQAPIQVGRTDARGRALFVPEGAGPWRLKAHSADGHGIDTRIDTAAAAPGAPLTGTGPNRASLILFGLSILLALFAFIQLWLRKKP